MTTQEESLQIRASITQELTKIWDEVRYKLPPEALDKDEVWYWWPTLIATLPNWEALTDNMLAYHINPYICALTMFYYGYAAGINHTQEEVGPLVNQDNIGQDRVPAWLREQVLSDLAERYKDKH